MIIGIFAFAGPPVGGLTAWLFMGLPGGHAPWPFIAGSYAEGFWLALATGLLLAIVSLYFDSIHWWAPLAAAGVTNAVFLAAGAALSGVSDPVAGIWRAASVFVPASFAATIACWAVARLLGMMK